MATEPAHPDEIVLSVIVPMRNAAATIGETVRSLFAQTLERPWELIVVDNGSSDDSRAVADTAMESGRPRSLRRALVTTYAERAGHASPRNHGVHESCGRYIAVCCADDVVAPTWGEEIVSALERHPYVSSNQVVMGAPYGEDSEASVPLRFGLPTAYGSGIAFTREIFDKVGGFDPAFDIGGEDGDFSLRVHRDLGIAPTLATAAIYYYRLNETGPATFRQGYRDGGTAVRLRHAHRDLVLDPPVSVRIVPHRFASAVRTWTRRRDGDSFRWAMRMIGYAVGRIVWSVRLRERYY